MKKTFTINLNHLVYHIDEDAYEALKQYLIEVEEQLFEDEKKEVMADIETRISELFEEKLQPSKQVINIKDVEEIINILGKPNQYNDQPEAEFDSDSDSAKASQAKSSSKRPVRKFYRDKDNRLLGGVLAGAAVYFGWDTVWVRLVFLLLTLFVWGSLIPIYFLLWLIIPAAKTVSQKLEMQGEDVTAERIKEEFQHLKDHVESDDFKESATSIGKRIGDVLLIILKAFAIFIAIIVGIIGFGLLVALLVAFSTWIFNPYIFADIIPDFFNFPNYQIILLAISSLFILFIPIFVLIRIIARVFLGKKSKSNAWGWFLGVMWFLSILIFVGISSSIAIKTLLMSWW